MKKIILFFFLVSGFAHIQSQNLVANPGFEDTLHCPVGFSQINFAPPWFDPSTMGTPDYFNECNNPNSIVHVPNNIFGNEYARTGRAYAGILTWGYTGNAREYIEAPLTDSLKAGIKYYVSFYASLADSIWYANSNIGAYFSTFIITDTIGRLLPYTPQVANNFTNPLINKNGWTLVAGTFTATGGEKYIVIGNFRSDTNPDTIFVGGGAKVGTYISYYYIDDVSVTEYHEALDSISTITVQSNLYPNPTNQTQAYYTNTLDSNQTGNLQVIDIPGHVLANYNLNSGSNKITISTAAYAKGVYIVKVNVAGMAGESLKLVVE